jgi:hypothetical protein
MYRGMRQKFRETRLLDTLRLSRAESCHFRWTETDLSRFWFNLADMPSVEQAAYGITNARVFYTPVWRQIRSGYIG